MSKNSIVFSDVTFFLRWYNVIHWSSHIYKKSSFLSFYSFLVKFSELMAQGKCYSKIEKVRQSWMGLKMPSCKWHNFGPMFNNGPMFNLLFYCHIILYWEKVSFHKKFSHNISKLSGKFQRFNTIDESIKIQKNIWISKNVN